MRQDRQRHWRRMNCDICKRLKCDTRRLKSLAMTFACSRRRQPIYSHAVAYFMELRRSSSRKQYQCKHRGPKAAMVTKELCTTNVVSISYLRRFPKIRCSTPLRPCKPSHAAVPLRGHVLRCPATSNQTRTRKKLDVAQLGWLQQLHAL